MIQKYTCVRDHLAKINLLSLSNFSVRSVSPTRIAYFPNLKRCGDFHKSFVALTDDYAMCTGTGQTNTHLHTSHTHRCCYTYYGLSFSFMHFTFHHTNVMMVIYLMLDIISMGYFTLFSSL